MNVQTVCPCGSLKPFEACCAPLLRGERSARTPLELMRSRYCAFATGNGAYVVRTTCKSARTPEDAEVIEAVAAQTRWIKLEIISHSETLEHGEVEFKAYCREGNALRVHHEQSSFAKEDGAWCYVDGRVSEGRLGRNDACPCGSKKKYKQCCARG